MLGLANTYSNGSMHSLGGGYVVPDNMSVVSGGSNISYVSQPQTIVDQNGRVSVTECFRVWTFRATSIQFLWNNFQVYSVSKNL